MQLSDKIALVAGAARGLGRAIALALAREGCDVVVSDLGLPAQDGIGYATAGAGDLEATAAAAVFLCRAESVTGTTLTVAGGGEVH